MPLLIYAFKPHMPIATCRAGRTGRVLAAFMLAAASLAACSDQLAVPVVQEELVKPSSVVQAFDCVASVADGVRCSAPRSAGGASRVLVSGQNEFVRLASSNASYDAGTETFSVNVTVQNLMNEAMGTPDGVTPDADGIQVFFHSDPVATSGSGQVLVANADGTGFFTGGDQPFFRYSEILDKDEVSASHPWQFSMPATVTSFGFSVLIETDMQYLLVINEVMANPNGTVDTDREWFEVYNAGTRTVNLQDLVITDSAASGRRPYHVIASSVEVPSGGYVVLGANANTTINGGVTVDYSYGGALVLSPSLDALKIARVVGTDTLTVDRTQYANGAISAQSGISRELKNPALDNSNMDGSNWADASVTSVYGNGGRGTPKAQNSAFTP